MDFVIIAKNVTHNTEIMQMRILNIVKNVQIMCINKITFFLNVILKNTSTKNLLMIIFINTNDHK